MALKALISELFCVCVCVCVCVNIYLGKDVNVCDLGHRCEQVCP